MEGFNNIDKKKVSRRGFLSGAAALGAGALGSSYGLDVGQEVAGPTQDNMRRLIEMRESIPADVPVTVDLDSEGKFVFSHEDQDTTELIDFLAGRGGVNEQALARNLRKAMFALMKESGVDMTVPENRDMLYQINSTEDILEVYDTYFHNISAERRQEFHDSAEYALIRIEEERVLDEEIRAKVKPELYEELWKIFIEAGGPRIELVDSYEERTPGRDNIYGLSDRFDDDGDGDRPLVYIDSAYKSDKMLDMLLQELAHSYNFYTDPEGFAERMEAKREFRRNNLSLEGDALAAANKRFYREEGHEEYEAHQIVYPRLVRRITQYHPTIEKYLEKALERLQNN